MAQENLDVVVKLVDEASANIRRIQGELNTLGSSAQTASKKTTTSMEDIRRGALVAGAAMTAMGGGIVLAAKSAVESASDLQESINAVNVVFGEGAEQVLIFGENSAQAVGLATAEFNQMSAQTGALLKDVGLPMEEVADLTNTLSVRAADLASVFNTDVSEAMSAINQAIRGETEAIRRFSGDVTDATLETFALAQGIEKTVSEMTQQEKRLLRVQLLMSQTDNVAGDFANTSESFANRMRVLRSEFENVSAQLGNALIPVVESLLEKVAPLLEKLAVWISENEELTEKIVIGVAAFGALMAVLGPLILTIAAVAAAINPVTLIIGAIILVIGVLAAQIVLLVRKFNEVRDTFMSYLPAIRDAWAEMTGAVSAKIDELRQNISDKFNAIGDFLRQVMNTYIEIIKFPLAFIAGLFISTLEALGIDVQLLFEQITMFIQMAMEKITGIFTSVTEWIKTTWSATFGELGPAAQSGLKKADEAILNFKNRMVTRFGEIKEALIPLWENMWATIKNLSALALDSIRGFVRGWANDFINDLNKIIRGINAIAAKAAMIPGVSAGSVPQIPEIPMLAKGGNIVGSGAAIVGENGPELLELQRGARVTPLDKAGGVTIIIQGNNVLNDDDLVEKIGDPLMQVMKQHFAVV